MKRIWSAHWNSSTQPRKQRKYVHNAPLHIKQKFVRVHLSKDLRKKHKARAVGIRVGDKVKVLVGNYKGKEGKIATIQLKNTALFIEGIERIKKDGSKVRVPFHPSNLLLIGLDKEEKRFKKVIAEKKKEEKKQEKMEKKK